MKATTYNILTLKSSLQADGWKEDNYGHFKKEIDGRNNRVKFQGVSVRVEVRSTCGTFWIRRTGEFYNKIKIDDQKKIIKVGSASFPLVQ